MRKIIVFAFIAALFIAYTGCGKQLPVEPPYPTGTFSASPDKTFTITKTRTATRTITKTDTPVPTGTVTETPTETPTATETATESATCTVTETSTETPTFTPTATQTNMPCSCFDIQQRNPTSLSGLYDITVLGETVQVYCDMVREGGGWTLVLLNSLYGTPPAPIWANLVNSVNITGSMSGGLTSFDLFLGVKFWNALGTTLMVEAGASSTDISHRATYTFSLNNTNNYAINLSSENILINTGTTASPGLYTYHNGIPLSSRDADHDNYGASCSQSYGNTAWWYNACWSGNYWGGGGVSYENKAYWSGSGSAGSEYYDYGAIWIK